MVGHGDPFRLSSVICPGWRRIGAEVQPCGDAAETPPDVLENHNAMTPSDCQQEGVVGQDTAKVVLRMVLRKMLNLRPILLIRYITMQKP